ncbi:MAG: Disulfide bond formation protein C [Chlamydiae bacterium]|nr:Disulfide bond formation protein C [Chlamydiota bacterium]
MKRYEIFLPWIIACIATVGSIFFGEVQNQHPCPLCWYQRILMFPLAIILGIAAFREAYRIVYYALPLSLIGLIISGYHVIMIEIFKKKSACPRCRVEGLSNDPVTFPFLSFCSFLVLSALLIWIAVKHHRSKKL